MKEEKAETIEGESKVAEKQPVRLLGDEKDLVTNYGPFKFKNDGRHGGVVIRNSTDEFIVIRELHVFRIQGTNKVQISLVMPNPEKVEVVKSKKVVVESVVKSEVEKEIREGDGTGK